jgi:hypothetical protein
LNAEGAKVAQRTQKRKYQKNTKKIKDIFINKSLTKKIWLFFSLCLLLRSLRNLRALCVQKIPGFYPHLKKLIAQAVPA